MIEKPKKYVGSILPQRGSRILAASASAGDRNEPRLNCCRQRFTEHTTVVGIDSAAGDIPAAALRRPAAAPLGGPTREVAEEVPRGHPERLAAGAAGVPRR